MGTLRECYGNVTGTLHVTHPVHDICPPLHGDALEDGHHGVDDVVKGGDAVVGSDPAETADGLARSTVEAFRLTGNLIS